MNKEPERESITKLEALKWTWIIWRDVAESYVDDKTGEYNRDPETKTTIARDKYGQSFMYDCPCCEFASQISSRLMCVGGCPMMEVWGASRETACESSRISPYRLFNSARVLADEYKYASQIADGAWELYLKECEAQGATPVDKFFTPITDKIGG